jgi:hypothetical protein
MDVDLTCFMMLTKDLSTLFGMIDRLINRKIKIKDIKEFACWIHIISNLVVVKIYRRTIQLERNAFKDEIVRTLRSRFGMTLNINYDSITLSKNQVNFAASVMSQSLILLGAKICHV